MLIDPPGADTSLIDGATIHFRGIRSRACSTGRACRATTISYAASCTKDSRTTREKTRQEFRRQRGRNAAPQARTGDG